MLPTSAWKRGVSGVADARTTSRAIALAAWSLLLAAGPASANGAMSLALGTFGWDLWGSYVLAIVLFEALFLGRCLRVPLGKALIYSLGANLLTAVVGGSVSGIFSYGFLGVFATRLNPNPFGQTLLLFTLFASLSAPVEAWVSSGAPSTLGGTSRRGRTLALALAVHLLAVPLGLAILLLPVRPYGGLESQVAGERQSIQREVVRALNQYVADHESLPPDRTYGEVLERLRPQLGSFVDEPGLWSAAYRPNYRRFDITEMRRVPIEWNAAAAHGKLFEGRERTVWLSRACDAGYCEGLVIDLPGASVSRTYDPAKLGLKERLVDK